MSTLELSSAAVSVRIWTVGHCSGQTLVTEELRVQWGVVCPGTSGPAPLPWLAGWLALAVSR